MKNEHGGKRKNAGRKKIENFTEKKVPVSFSLPEYLDGQISYVAKSLGISKSEYIFSLLKDPVQADFAKVLFK